MRNVTVWHCKKISHLPRLVRVFVYKGKKSSLNNFLFPAYVYGDLHLRPRLGAPGSCSFFDPDHKGQVVVMGYESEEKALSGDGAPLIITNTKERAIHWLVNNAYYEQGEESDRKNALKIKPFDKVSAALENARIAAEFERDQTPRLKHGTPPAVPAKNNLEVVLVQPCVVEPKTKVAATFAGDPIAPYADGGKVEISFPEAPVAPQSGFVAQDVESVDISAGKPETEQVPGKLEIVHAVAEDRVIGNTQSIKPPVQPTPPASRVLNDQGAPVKTKKPTFMDNMMKFLRLFKK